jgi:hypothetical protein
MREIAASPHGTSKLPIHLKVAVSPTSTTLDDAECNNSRLPKRYRWQPTFWRIQPLLGILALTVTISCLFVSLGILYTSNGDKTSIWYFQPTVYLAIASACSNAALQCALHLAAPVSWWYKALRGSTVKDLELDWEAGESFPRAFLNTIIQRRRLSLFSVASLATALVLVDGPLLQRASSVQRATVIERIQLNISAATQLPVGFSVQISDVGAWKHTAAAVDIFTQHIHDKPITSDAYCDGTCHATIRALGYAPASCWNQSWAINETMLRDPNSTWGIGGYRAPGGGTDGMPTQPLLYSTAFPAGANWCRQQREPLIVATGTANYRNCEGEFTFTNCTMLPAVLDFAVTIRNNTITYDSSSIRKRAVSTAESYCYNETSFATLGFVGLMQPYVTANGSLGQGIIFRDIPSVISQ